MNEHHIARDHYQTLPSRHETLRKRLGRPITYAEKVLLSHLDDIEGQELERGVSYGAFRPDRVAMQDATAQMALLQFMGAGRTRVAVPSTVHCDHLIRAQTFASEDLNRACDENAEVYEFLRSVSEKYGIGFWKPGAGIIHQVVLENYAFPGGMMIGTDSHTPNAGGLGMVAIGVGGADAVDVMVGLPWTVRMPKLIGVHLTGELSGWTASKDVILKLLGILTVKGGTGAIVEYFGPGTDSISCTGKATITNMGAELGATTSIFPYDPSMAAYIRATGRDELATLVEANAEFLVADAEIEADPARFYDQVVEIDLSTLEPHLVGPHTPDMAHPVSRMAKDCVENDYPETISVGLIGSCTNSSYEDMDRVASLARQAAAAGLKPKAPLLVTPGSERVFRTIRRDGQLEALEAAGATVLANACGPCIGQWKRMDNPDLERNSIVTSFNRNFRRRNDGNPNTLAFISSPETVIAMAFGGTIGFDASRDAIPLPGGGEFRFEAPTGRELPEEGFLEDPDGFIPPAEDGSAVEVVVKPDSERLELLQPFSVWSGEDYEGLHLLMKADGKCTTDHISAAGPWLRYRGHLDAISNNMFLGAINAFSGDTGKGKHQGTGEVGEFQEVARAYKAAGERWIVVGDENYGEGSSREHAAMSPRHLGAAAVLVRGFARIHETNLKKQGVLPLTFTDAADYEKVREDDRVDVRGLKELAPGSSITVVLHHGDGTEDTLACGHTMSPEQIEWFQAGSALNWIRDRNAK
jgi:aconitate hydratase A / 2-methylisocitrate dehydratase